MSITKIRKAISKRNANKMAKAAEEMIEKAYAARVKRWTEIKCASITAIKEAQDEWGTLSGPISKSLLAIESIRPAKEQVVTIAKNFSDKYQASFGN